MFSLKRLYCPKEKAALLEVLIGANVKENLVVMVDN